MTSSDQSGSGAPSLRVEIDPEHQELTLHVTPDGIAMLRSGLDDAERGGKVFLGDKPLLIIRPVGWNLPHPALTAPESAAVASAWAVMASAELSPSSDELAMLATLEAMRMMLVDADPDVQRRGREGLRGMLTGMIVSLRQADPDGLTRVVEQWRPAAEAMGLEW